MPDDTVTYPNFEPSMKNSKRHFDEISEVFNRSCAYSDATDNSHDPLKENNLVIKSKSPHGEFIKMEMETVEVRAVRKMTMIDKLMVESNREHDNVENGVKSVEENGSPSVGNLEKCKSYFSEEDQMASSVLQKQENPEVPYKESLLQFENNDSSPTISDTDVGLVSGAQEKHAKATNHDNGYKSSDVTPLCGKITLEQMPMTSAKLEKELGQAFEVPFGVTISIYGDPFSVDNTEENNSSSIVDVIKHITSSIINRKKNLLEFSHCSMQPEVPVFNSCPSKKLLILDINGLLADIVSPPPKGYKPDINIARRAIFKRPFYSEFLNFCLERFDVGIWSSRTKKNVERVTDYLLGDMKQKMLFCWDLSHCTATGLKTLENKHKDLVCKELRKIWEKDDSNLPWERGVYNESNTLLLDDSPYKALLNPPHSAIFPHSYKFHNKDDGSLGCGGDIRRYLEELYAAENVQKFVEQHLFGQGAINESNSSWDYYNRIISSPRLPLALDPCVESIKQVNLNQNGGEDLGVNHLPL